MFRWSQGVTRFGLCTHVPRLNPDVDTVTRGLCPPDAGTGGLCPMGSWVLWEEVSLLHAEALLLNLAFEALPAQQQPHTSASVVAFLCLSF